MILSNTGDTFLYITTNIFPYIKTSFDESI